MSYQFLSDDEKVRILDEVTRAVPDPAVVQLARERDHYRRVLLGKAGLGDVPAEIDVDPYDAQIAAAHAALLEERRKLPPPVEESPPIEAEPLVP